MFFDDTSSDNWPIWNGREEEDDQIVRRICLGFHSKKDDKVTMISIEQIDEDHEYEREID